MAQRSSRKRRKQRQRAARPADTVDTSPADTDDTSPAETEEPSDKLVAPKGEDPEMTAARGYARGRAKDEAARAALKPLAPGERPTAVTVGAVVAGVFFVANLVALVVGFDGEGGVKPLGAIAGCVLLAVMGVGMWRVRYWAVLGMQALLAITLVFASLAFVNSGNLAAAAFSLALIALAGPLFWFLVKSMARIQMPQRPGSSR